MQGAVIKIVTIVDTSIKRVNLYSKSNSIYLFFNPLTTGLNAS